MAVGGLGGSVAGFGEGFSAGLGQGMGIINQAKDNARADQQLQFQRDQAKITNDRAARQEARDIVQFGWKAEDHPIEHAKLQGELKQQDATLQGTLLENEGRVSDNQKKAVEAQYAAPKAQADLQHTQVETAAAGQRMTLDRKADARADRAQSFSFAMQGHQDARAQEEHDMKVASYVMPYYSQIIANGGTPSPEMQKAIARSPFGINQIIDNANASAHFPQVLNKLAKGDTSWMQNPDERTGMAALARSRAMAMAGQRGMVMGSARVTGMEPGQGGTVNLGVVAFNPKTRQYEHFTQPVNTEKLLSEMHTNAATGSALQQHPQWPQIQQQMGKLAGGKAYGGDIVKAANDDYDTIFRQNMSIIDQASKGTTIPKESIQAAQKWLTQYSNNRDGYVSAYTGTAKMAQNARGADVNPMDYNRVFATSAKYTGSFDTGPNLDRVNQSLRIMDKVQNRLDSAPDLKKFVGQVAKGQSLDDPAVRVRVVNEIYRNPQMRQLTHSLIRGQ